MLIVSCMCLALQLCVCVWSSDVFPPLTCFPLLPGVVVVSAGSTATVALLRDGIELVVGSVGDSRAMLCRKAKALKLTSDHTPERKDEKERYGRYPGSRKT